MLSTANSGVCMGKYPSAASESSGSCRIRSVVVLFGIYVGFEPRTCATVTSGALSPCVTLRTIVGFSPETAGAEALLGFNCALWSCERVHRILDDAATWNEDRCRVRSGHGPENLTCLRRLAFGLVLGRGKSVAPTIRNLNPRLVRDWLRLSRNTQPRAKSAA